MATHLHRYKAVPGTNLTACVRCDKAKKAPQKVIDRQSVQYLRKKAWPYCSEFNRRKDCGPDGYGKCVTCGKIFHWKSGDAGHFRAGRNNSILFYDKGIHLQCKQCNGHFRRGATVPEVDREYEEYMIGRYGQEEVDKIDKLKRDTKQFTPKELEQKIEDYKGKINDIEACWIQGKPYQN